MAEKNRIGAQRNISDVGSRKKKMFRSICPLRRKIWPIGSNVESLMIRDRKRVWDLET